MISYNDIENKILEFKNKNGQSPNYIILGSTSYEQVNRCMQVTEDYNPSFRVHAIKSSHSDFPLKILVADNTPYFFEVAL